MGIGDVPLPVGSGVEPNNPVPPTGVDARNRIDDRLRVLERAGFVEVLRQIEWLYENLPGGPYPYPPP